MITRLFGPSSRIGAVKNDLDTAHRLLQEKGDRVANLGTEVDGEALRAAGFTEEQIDELMAGIASLQLRIEAGFSMLQKSYQGIRTGLREG